MDMRNYAIDIHDVDTELRIELLDKLKKKGEDVSRYGLLHNRPLGGYYLKYDINMELWHTSYLIVNLDIIDVNSFITKFLTPIDYI